VALCSTIRNSSWARRSSISPRFRAAKVRGSLSRQQNARRARRRGGAPADVEGHRELVEEELADPVVGLVRGPAALLRTRMIRRRVAVGRAQLGEPEDELGLLGSKPRPFSLQRPQPVCDLLARRRGERDRVRPEDGVDDDRPLEEVRRRHDPELRTGYDNFRCADQDGRRNPVRL
jgi:hypothetical protein